MLALLLAEMLLLGGCANQSRVDTEAKAENQEAMHIVCSSFPCYDFVRAVAGEPADVTLLVKPGMELHSYEPTPSDIREIAECELFVCVGGESDAWVDDVLSTFGEDGPRVLRLIESVKLFEEEELEGMTLHEQHSEEEAVEYDEHVWTSPVNAMRMVEAVRDALCELQPAQAELFRDRADAYLGELSEIDSQLRELVGGAARRELVFGDRFPFIYLVREYGLRYWAAFPSCTAESEPSARTLRFLIEKVRSDEVPVVYQIELSAGRTAQAIAEETGAQVLTLQSIQNLSAADFAAGATYVSLMEENIEALRKGLY